MDTEKDWVMLLLTGDAAGENAKTLEAWTGESWTRNPDEALIYEKYSAAGYALWAEHVASASAAARATELNAKLYNIRVMPLTVYKRLLDERRQKEQE